MKRLSIIILLLTLVSVAAFTDVSFRKDPTGYVSRGGNYLAEIFPENTKVNGTKKPVCYFYKKGEGEDSYELLWKDTLVNQIGPYQAIVSTAGDLVTINDESYIGGQHSVVIYDRKGRLIRTYDLDELIPRGDDAWDWVLVTTSARVWNYEAKYYFTGANEYVQDPTHLYIKLQCGKVMQFRLHDGAYHYGPLAAFPVLESLSKRQMPWEETPVDGTSLRFSSLTELLICKGLIDD